MDDTSTTRLLLIEDGSEDARQLLDMLNEQGSPITKARHVGSVSQAEKHLAGHAVDIVLLDIGLPDTDGLDAIRRIRAAAPNVPLVVLTGPDDESLAVQALQEGAQDCFVKGQVESRALRRGLRQAIERKVMEEALSGEKERAQVTLDCIGDAVVSTDRSGNITFINVVAERMTAWSRIEATGRSITEVLRISDASTREAAPDPMAIAVGRNRTVHLPSSSVLVRRDGLECPIEGIFSPIHDRNGEAAGAVTVFRDASAARATSLQMSHAAQHDFLTGLPNRLLLNDRVNQALASAPRHKRQVAVLFLDLDGFKHINDSLGHAIGDKLLQSIAKRLVACVRASDTVSRQGGDEFVVLLSEADQWEDAATTARRILQAVAEPHTIDQHDLYITTSIGVAVFPDDGADADSLIQNADIAMYEAKEKGRQGCQFFKPTMNTRAVERQFIVDGLRRALERHEFALHYQPKISLTTGSITGAEALIRWTHPTRGLVPPADFIPIAEDCRLILPISKWVLREACAQAQTWVEAGLPVATMAVNVSAIAFQEESFLADLFALLDETGLDPRSLELELTEGILMKHAESVTSILQTLRERGVQVTIDDFGTGYSSLSYLRKFPVDALKIDQSFVRQISTDGDDTAIVTAVISMARNLKLRVIAEGVETLEQIAFLQAHECDEAQGFYFSPPVPPEEFARLLERGLLETVAAEDLERRITVLEREIAIRDRRIEDLVREKAERGSMLGKKGSPDGSWAGEHVRAAHPDAVSAEQEQ